MDPTTLPAVIVSAFFVTFATVIVPSPSTIAASRYAVTHGTRAAAACLSGVVVLDIVVFLSLAYGFEPVLYRIGGHRYLLPAAAMLLLSLLGCQKLIYDTGPQGEGDAAGDAAGKTFVVIGFSDCALLLGVLLLWQLTGTLRMSAFDGVPVSGGVLTAAYLLLLTGALVKAGAMPGHTWIPKAAEGAPVSVMAYLPASLDKLLGIYLLARISLRMFALNDGLRLLLLVIGAVTIVLAVMMALVQHNLKKLLAFHAVSQVGYMVMGIGTGVPLGIAGGLFHMLNNALYKCCLFLGAGAV